MTAIAPIVKIGIHPGISGTATRVAVVLDPETGQFRSHGMGSVGSPMLPYLSHRTEGYSLVLPEDRRDLYVFRINWDGAPNPKGRYPEVRLPWEELQAPDIPTLAPFAADEETS
jgi:hypothetical protein